MKIPKVAIIGFPNVGKSTLFNRILGRKKALVHSLPGMTRDKIYGMVEWKNKKFELIDTGGMFSNSEEPLSKLVEKKAMEAAKEADVIMFVIDGRREILPAEEELFVSLKKLNKPLLIVVNKIDTPSVRRKYVDVYKFGNEKILFVSAEHKKGIEELKDCLIEYLPEGKKEKIAEKPIKIAIVGRINVGKSSLINRLLGEERLIVSEIPGTTRDSVDTLVKREGRYFILVDTAGIRRLGKTKDKKEKAAIIKAKKNIKEADVICLVLDALESPTHQDATIAQLAALSWKPLIVAVNKWDLIPKNKQNTILFEERIYQKLSFVSYAPLIFVSAVTGKRVVKILDLSLQVYENSIRRISTPQLNRFLHQITKSNPPITKKREPVKIKYMVQTGIHPPTFSLYSSKKDPLLPNYEKFFTNKMREEFDLWGTPIKLVIKKK